MSRTCPCACPAGGARRRSRAGRRRRSRRCSSRAASCAAGHRLSNQLFVSRNSSPLAIGLGDNANFIGSDAHSIDHLTQRIIYLEDGDHALLRSNNISIFDKNLKKVSRKIINIQAEIGLITKGGYKHFMEKEIFEQPAVLPQTTSSYVKNNSEIKIDLDKLGFENKKTLIICAAGTSYYSGMVGKYWIEQIADIPVIGDLASE